MCPHTSTYFCSYYYVSSYYCICRHTTVCALTPPYMCPHRLEVDESHPLLLESIFNTPKNSIFTTTNASSNAWNISADKQGLSSMSLSRKSTDVPGTKQFISLGVCACVHTCVGACIRVCERACVREEGKGGGERRILAAQLKASYTSSLRPYTL